MGETRDIVIVGGGPAGTTTAIALAHAAPDLARRALLLERSRYPRDKPCAGALGARGDALLRELGVDIDVPSTRVDGVWFRSRHGEATASPGRIGRVVRRVEFDHALARAAASRGVELREGVRVESVEQDDRGVVVRTSAGEFGAKVVVGCDGVGSTVRRGLGAGPGELRAQVIEVDTEPVVGDRDRAFLCFDASDPRVRGYAWDFPTLLGGRELVCRGIYHLRTERDRSADGLDLAALLAERLEARGIDPARCANKRYAERGFEPTACLARGRCMLVGEAAGIDPVTGEGIAQAIEFGVMAGRFLARTLGQLGAGARLDRAWQTAVAASRLARDLRIRARFVRLYYGRSRSAVERYLAESPDALFVGCQHFAAQPYDPLMLVDALVRGAAHLLAVRLADLLAV